MAKELLVGIDVGTTGVKAVLCDGEGRILAQAGEEHPTSYPHPGWAEQDPDDWWRALCRLLPQLFRTRPAADVAGLAVSCQAPTPVAVDGTGRPLAPAQLWMDRRAETQCAWLAEQVGGEAIAAINGGRIDSYYQAPKLLWLRDAAPDIYAAAHVFLQPNGYLVHKLCGRFSVDAAHGPLTLYFDSAAGTWSGALLERMGLDEAKLPPLHPCAEVVGEVSTAAAAATGLAAGTPVLAGAVDGAAAGLEAGLVAAGDAVEMSGQSSVLLVASDCPYHGRKLIPLGHAAPGRWLVVGAMVASGGALRWVRDQLGGEERRAAAATGRDPFDLLTELAAASPPGANRLIFLPYLYGERSPIWDSRARGVFFGLSQATTKADMVRAVLEGTAYGLRHNVESAAAGGFPLARLACVGGGTRSALWNQIKADVLQQTLTVPAAATGAPFGDAVLAAVGVELHKDFATAVAAMCAAGEVYTPNAELAPLYDAGYALYCRLYPALRESYQQLAELPGSG